jgi:hypothetical protein
MTGITSRVRFAIAAAACTLACAGAAIPAGAVTAAPGYSIGSFAMPTNFSAAHNAACLQSINGAEPECDGYQVTVANVGSRPTDGTAVTLTDLLPQGVTVQRITFFWRGPGAQAFAGGAFNGVDLGTSLCSTSPKLQCALPLAIQPDDTLEMFVYVTVDDPSASTGLTNSATASGGGAPEAKTSAPNTVGEATPTFAPSAFSTLIAGADGQPDTQAGDHPYEFTARIDLANTFKQDPETGFAFTSVAALKDVVVDLPLGFLGSALAAPTCTFAQFSSNLGGGLSGCPTDTIVGHILTEPLGSPADGLNGPIYNLVPEHGVAAEFGLADLLGGPHVIYARVVPTPAGYVLRSTSPDLPEIALQDIVATFFGNPAAQPTIENAGLPNPPPPSGVTPAAMFTNPTDCSAGPLTSTLHIDSWAHPGRLNADGSPDLSDPNWISATSSSPPVTGCNKLQFSSSLSVQPETTVADSPSGLNVDIKVPQSEDPLTLATPPLKNAVVTLPAGFTVNPSSAAGLGACSPVQVALGSAASPTCPENSKIGTVELTTPLLPGTLTGSIYLASQFENPFNSLIAGYIVVDDPTTGVVVKIPGEITTNEQTGQITGVFDNNPQFPFSDLKLHFKGGPTGVLATPESCGTFTSTSAFAPWSAPYSGPASTPSDPFSITSGCVSGFAPSFSAGTTNPQAGAFSPFVLSFSRADTDQELSGLSVKLPPGMLAKLAGVPLCSEQALASISNQPGTGAAQAANPSCPAGSQVGTVQTGAGVGPTPFFVGGKAYLTGPYKGAPYGLAVVVPALAGPFDLGTVVVRQALFVDPTTAQVTAVSDPFPTILDGIPLRIRRVDVSIDRPGFTLNPTSCDPMAVTASLASVGGLSAPLSSPFQVGGCAGLAFKPIFKISTSGKTSKANGASLTVKVSQSPGEANIHKVNLQLPLALPSRLTTLQKACLAAQFAVNPAGCPEGSNIGTAKAVTPLLGVPLTGPAYLVSHGGAAFPDVEFLLQGSGVTILLDGKTDIKKGITYSKFETVPDAPISSFETVLPEGPHSILAAFGNLCTSNLVSPTTITGQNGAVLKQTTAIQVTGCAQQISITKRKLAGNNVSATFSTTVKGLVTITGPGLRKTSKTLAPGSHTVNLPLTATGRTARRDHRTIKIKATLKVAKRVVFSTTKLKL